MITADEAHKPHENDLKEWVRGLHTDPMRTLAHIPQTIFNLLCELGYYDLSVTEAGMEFISD